MDPDETWNKMAGYEDNLLLDFFPVLPESVIHHILSFLPFKDIVRTCVLSKAWNSIWSNYPNIDITLHEDDYSYTSLQPLQRPFAVHAQMFFDQCLFRKVCIHKMHLCFSTLYLKENSLLMDRWLGAAIRRNVSELVIKVRCYYMDGAWYSLPEDILFSHTLKVLELEGCKFEDRVPYMDLPHLQKLKLYVCKFVGENVLPKILCGCPEMEFLEVSCCEGVGSSLSILRKSRLKCFTIKYVTEFKRIEIFAPSVETLKFSLVGPCSIHLADDTSLKHLGLVRVILDDYFPIQRLLSKLLYIETLKLVRCKGVDKIRISSSHLKGLVIRDCGGFRGAEIDAPNLLSLKYSFSTECSSSNWFSWNVPKVEEVHFKFSVKNFHSACRGGLKGFLKKLQNFEDLKLVVQLNPEAVMPDFIIHERLHAVSFSSLNKFLKRVKPRSVIISSRRVESFLACKLAVGGQPKRLFVIYSFRQSIELLHKKLSTDKILQLCHIELKLVSMEEIEHEMDSACKSFVETRSNGYHTAGITSIQVPH